MKFSKTTNQIMLNNDESGNIIEKQRIKSSFLNQSIFLNSLSPQSKNV